jgi:hypothetical protein
VRHSATFEPRGELEESAVFDDRRLTMAIEPWEEKRFTYYPKGPELRVVLTELGHPTLTYAPTCVIPNFQIIGPSNKDQVKNRPGTQHQVSEGGKPHLS